MYICPRNIVFNMSYKDSCELSGDVILITAALRHLIQDVVSRLVSTASVQDVVSRLVSRVLNL